MSVPTRVTQVLFDPVDDGTVWASVEIGSIYRSENRGLTWERKENGLVSGDVHGLAVMRLKGGRKAVFATTNRGLHRSEDNGETWALQELPSPWPYTRSVVPRADDSGVIFVTNGNGPPGNDGFLAALARLWAYMGGREAPRRAREHRLVRRHQPDRSDAAVCLHQSRRRGPQRGRRRALDAPARTSSTELRALHWRALPQGTRKAAHAITRPVLKAAQMGWAAR